MAALARVWRGEFAVLCAQPGSNAVRLPASRLPARHAPLSELVRARWRRQILVLRGHVEAGGVQPGQRLAEDDQFMMVMLARHIRLAASADSDRI